VDRRRARGARDRGDLRADVVGGPDTVRAGLDRHVADTLADEVMVISDTFNPAQRRASYTRLARDLRRSRRRPRQADASRDERGAGLRSAGTAAG
jgi:hypothetical protein